MARRDGGRSKRVENAEPSAAGRRGVIVVGLQRRLGFVQTRLDSGRERNRRTEAVISVEQIHLGGAASPEASIGRLDPRIVGADPVDSVSAVAAGGDARAS